ncbi:MAG: hypothetical protein JWN25_1643 [Verrucomicrobiales bacterium]|nr:hypothetical protein [Verrucomicrobiales bacterium]
MRGLQRLHFFAVGTQNRDLWRELRFPLARRGTCRPGNRPFPSVRKPRYHWDLQSTWTHRNLADIPRVETVRKTLNRPLAGMLRVLQTVSPPRSAAIFTVHHADRRSKAFDFILCGGLAVSLDVSCSEDLKKRARVLVLYASFLHGLLAPCWSILWSSFNLLSELRVL